MPNFRCRHSVRGNTNLTGASLKQWQKQWRVNSPYIVLSGVTFLIRMFTCHSANFIEVEIYNFFIFLRIKNLVSGVVLMVD